MQVPQKYGPSVSFCKHFPLEILIFIKGPAHNLGLKITAFYKHLPWDSAGSFEISQFGMQQYLENVCSLLYLAAFYQT